MWWMIRWRLSVAADSARLILASGSPRRLELLRLAGLDPDVQPANVDERARTGEGPAAHVRRLARAKACVGRDASPGSAVLGADTVVVVDDDLLGKPCDDAHAAQMLRRLSGRAHIVMTGVALVDRGGRVADQVVSTRVVMTALSPERIARYIATGEPLDKAGAYAIQGRAGAFVQRIEGSWTNVVGLPLVETLEMLAEAGVVTL